jgi:hypothetical protein
MPPRAGYKGKVKIGATTVGGATTWNYSGDVRQMLDAGEFGQEGNVEIPGGFVGGDVTIQGNFLLDTDAGQQLLKTNYESGANITNLQLYLSETDSVYMELDNSTTPASYCNVTSYNSTSTEKAGIGKFTATLHVSGRMVPNP